MKIPILIFFLFFFNIQFILSQETPEVVEVDYNLYAIFNPHGGNSAFLVTRKGVVVIDAGSSPENGEQILSAIRSTTSKPIKYLILTHSHGDHINGISCFPKDIIIIAHSNLKNNHKKFNEPKLTNYHEKIFPEHISQLKQQLDSYPNKESPEYEELVNNYNSSINYLENIKRIKFREPDITFEDFYRFKLADERITLEYPGPGHTNDNILVKFSNHNVIHTGDIVFNGEFPYLIVEHGVDVYNWIRILDDIYKENIITVIPGHGEVDRKISLKKQADYFKELSSQIQELIDKGYDLDKIKEEISINNFKLKGNEDQLPVNIEVIYTELVKDGITWWKF